MTWISIETKMSTAERWRGMWQRKQQGPGTITVLDGDGVTQIL